MPVKLGELLLKENMVTPQQLQEALSHQKMNGGKLGKAFVTLGYVKDEEITSLLSRQYGVPSINLDHFEVDPAIIKIIPAETARKYQILPLSRSGATLTIAMADPTNVFAMDDIKFMTGYNVEPVVASETSLEDAIEKYYGSTRSLELRRDSGGGGGGGGGSLKDVLDAPGLTVDDMASVGLSEVDLDSMSDAEADVEQVKEADDEIDLGNLSKSADAAPVVKLVNVLLVDSLKRGASDIHIEPYEKEFRVRFRIDGILYNVMALPMKLRDPLTSRIKIMAKLDIAEKRLPQDGRIKIKMKIEDRSRDLDFRVSCLPTLWGEKIVMRLLDKSKLMLDMTKLGFETALPRALQEGHRQALRDRARDGPHGLRQDQHPLLGHRQPQQARHQHHDRRGPRGVQPPGHQPGPDPRQHRPELRVRAARASCARTRTSSWWGRSATTRRRRSRSRPPSPATSCSPPCTPTTPPRPSRAS